MSPKAAPCSAQGGGGWGSTAGPAAGTALMPSDGDGDRDGDRNHPAKRQNLGKVRDTQPWALPSSRTPLPSPRHLLGPHRCRDPPAKTSSLAAHTEPLPKASLERHGGSRRTWDGRDSAVTSPPLSRELALAGARLSSSLAPEPRPPTATQISRAGQCSSTRTGHEEAGRGLVLQNPSSHSPSDPVKSHQHQCDVLRRLLNVK